MWFSQNLADGVNNIRAETVKTNKWFSTKWKDQSVYFAFEGGDSANRWKVIANEAINLAETQGAKRLILFRTPDLKQVPKPGWKAIGPIIDKAIRVGLDVHLLDLASVCEIHAARDLYSDALQGNVDQQPEDILAWLKNHFEKRIVDLCSGTAARISEPKTKVAKIETTQATALSSKQRNDVLHLIEVKRFVSAHDVIQQLKLSVSVEILLKEIQGAPIRTFPGPETVVIQWRNPQSP
jgi:hypothetical protein